MINGAFAAALQPCNTLVVPGFGGTVYHVTVESFDVPDGAAQVSIGSGRGTYRPCYTHALASNRILPTLSHALATDIFKP